MIHVRYGIAIVFILNVICTLMLKIASWLLMEVIPLLGNIKAAT